jgi:hypothetical protein
MAGGAVSKTNRPTNTTTKSRFDLISSCSNEVLNVVSVERSAGNQRNRPDSLYRRTKKSNAGFNTSRRVLLSRNPFDPNAQPNS